MLLTVWHAPFRLVGVTAVLFSIYYKYVKIKYYFVPLSDYNLQHTRKSPNKKMDIRATYSFMRV